MALEQAAGAFIALNLTNGSCKASPTAGIFGKLRIRRLEEDLYAVEGGYNSFGLNCSERDQYMLCLGSPEFCMHLPHSPLTLPQDRFSRHNRVCASSRPRRVFVCRPQNLV